MKMAKILIMVALLISLVSCSNTTNTDNKNITEEITSNVKAEKVTDKVVDSTIIETGIDDLTVVKNNIEQIECRFHRTTEGMDIKDDIDTLYCFKTRYNGNWLLTAEEIGFIPEENTDYIITYDNNGTTKDNKPCDCIPEWECECEIYDDIFIEIKKNDKA